MDITSSQDSQVPVHRPEAHRFPDFAGSGGISATEANAVEQDPFKPLFRDAAADEVCPSSDGPGDDDANDQMEQARQRGYMKGLEAGRHDACRMADSLLAPLADRFQQAWDCLANYQQYIIDHASTHILKLAVEISERIIGAETFVTVADLQPLHRALIEANYKRYQLQLRYHHQDLSELEHLMECRGGNGLKMTAGLSCEKDLDVAQGALVNDHGNAKGCSLEKQVQQSLAQLLQAIETARKPGTTGQSGPNHGAQSTNPAVADRHTASTK
jgi:hypothetical protein